MAHRAHYCSAACHHVDAITPWLHVGDVHSVTRAASEGSGCAGIVSMCSGAPRLSTATEPTTSPPPPSECPTPSPVALPCPAPPQLLIACLQDTFEHCLVDWVDTASAFFVSTFMAACTSPPTTATTITGARGDAIPSPDPQPSPHILIHCAHGRSRSAGMAAALLLTLLRMPLTRAFHAIRSRRRCMDINDGFATQLLLVSLLVHGDPTASGDAVVRYLDDHGVWPWHGGHPAAILRLLRSASARYTAGRRCCGFEPSVAWGSSPGAGDGMSIALPPPRPAFDTTPMLTPMGLRVGNSGDHVTELTLDVVQLPIRAGGAGGGPSRDALGWKGVVHQPPTPTSPSMSPGPLSPLSPVATPTAPWRRRGGFVCVRMHDILAASPLHGGGQARPPPVTAAQSMAQAGMTGFGAGVAGDGTTLMDGGACGTGSHDGDRTEEEELLAPPHSHAMPLHVNCMLGRPSTACDTCRPLTATVNTPHTAYACNDCGCILFSSLNIVRRCGGRRDDEGSGFGSGSPTPASSPASSPCTLIFLEPMSWMAMASSDESSPTSPTPTPTAAVEGGMPRTPGSRDCGGGGGNGVVDGPAPSRPMPMVYATPLQPSATAVMPTEGRLTCPACAAKVGHFTWLGGKHPCPCGKFTPGTFPSFAIHASAVRTRSLAGTR